MVLNVNDLLSLNICIRFYFGKSLSVYSYIVDETHSHDYISVLSLNAPGCKRYIFLFSFNVRAWKGFNFQCKKVIRYQEVIKSIERWFTLYHDYVGKLISVEIWNFQSRRFLRFFIALILRILNKYLITKKWFLLKKKN